MSIEIVLEGRLEEKTDEEAFSVLLKRTCDEKKLKLEDYDATVMIDIHPEGYTECGYEDRLVSIAAQTSVAGPGFHAFVCTILDEIVSGSQIPLEVSDPTGYYTDRNLENLKCKYFYRWLGDIQDYVLDYIDEEEELYIFWPQGYYHPVYREGFVVTPLGCTHRDGFQTRNVGGSVDGFFVRSGRKCIARYYRNYVMALLQKECYFAYSSMNEYTDKIANSILDYLEAAHEKDDLLPLPMDAYRNICTVIHREILIQHADGPEIVRLGYRNGVVSYPLGSWNISAHSCSEKSSDEATQTMHFMAPYKDTQEPWKWMIKANAYTLEKEIPTFLRKLEKSTDVIDAFNFEKEAMICKGIAENLDEYYTVIVQVSCEENTLFLECIVCDEQDITILKEWHQGAKYRVTISDESYSRID